MADKLDSYIAQERRKPFEWGVGNGDCLLFLLGWGELHGKTASRSWRLSYDDEAGARKALLDFGGGIAAVTDVYGSPRMGSCHLRGDVGLLEVDGWFLGMICTGSMWAFRDGARGIRMVRSEPDICWSLGVRI